MDFDAIPGRACESGWDHAAQGGDGRPVHCCFAVVAAKHWVFPPAWAAGPPIEFSIGRIQANSDVMGSQLLAETMLLVNPRLRPGGGVTRP